MKFGNHMDSIGSINTAGNTTDINGLINQKGMQAIRRMKHKASMEGAQAVGGSVRTSPVGRHKLSPRGSGHHSIEVLDS